MSNPTLPSSVSSAEASPLLVEKLGLPGLWILMLLVAGFVSHLQSREGLMVVYEGDRSDYAKSYHDPSIEVTPLNAEGGRTEPYVVSREAFGNLGPEDTLAVRLPELPFDLEVRGFQRNGRVLDTGRDKSGGAHEPVVDGFFLRQMEREKVEERNQAACYVTIVDKGGNPIFVYEG